MHETKTFLGVPGEAPPSTSLRTSLGPARRVGRHEHETERGGSGVHGWVVARRTRRLAAGGDDGAAGQGPTEA